MRLLQERRGGQCSSYIYEPGSYTPLARIDGQGALEPEHPASALALGDVDTARGKENSVPTTNGEWADAHHAVAGPVGGLARKLAALDKAQAAQPQSAVMENSPPTPSLAGAMNVNERSAAPGARIYYFHTQANGLPEEMSDRNGNLVWRAQYRAWGSAVAEEWQAFDAAGRPVGAPVVEGWARASQQMAVAPQNLRMQGQYLDRETGLHYNTFRYYDPDLGSFTTPDPIGLAGGTNLHRYATNPIAWVDPWGWCAQRAQEASRGRNAALNEAKRDLGIPRSQHPDAVNKIPMTDRNGKSILGADGKPLMTREYTYTRPDGSKVVIQDHSAGHQFGQGGVGDQGPHFNVRPPENTRTGAVPGTQDHYSW